jgi:hypothetical protein
MRMENWDFRIRKFTRPSQIWNWSAFTSSLLGCQAEPGGAIWAANPPRAGGAKLRVDPQAMK